MTVHLGSAAIRHATQHVGGLPVISSSELELTWASGRAEHLGIHLLGICQKVSAAVETCDDAMP